MVPYFGSLTAAGIEFQLAKARVSAIADPRLILQNIVALGKYAHIQPSECLEMEWEMFLEIVEIANESIERENREIEKASHG